MHTNSNPASRPHHHHPLKLLGNGRPHTHHKFQPEPRKSYPPSPTSTILPKKAPIFLDIHNRFQNIALLVSSRIIDFLSYDFNSIRCLSLSIFCSLFPTTSNSTFRLAQVLPARVCLCVKVIKLRNIRPKI